MSEKQTVHNISTIGGVEFLSLPPLRSNQREAKPSSRAVRGWERLRLFGSHGYFSKGCGFKQLSSVFIL